MNAVCCHTRRQTRWCTLCPLRPLSVAIQGAVVFRQVQARYKSKVDYAPVYYAPVGISQHAFPFRAALSRLNLGNL